jgi:hypothetical protein
MEDICKEVRPCLAPVGLDLPGHIECLVNIRSIKRRLMTKLIA